MKITVVGSGPVAFYCAWKLTSAGFDISIAAPEERQKPELIMQDAYNSAEGVNENQGLWGGFFGGLKHKISQSSEAADLGASGSGAAGLETGDPEVSEQEIFRPVYGPVTPRSGLVIIAVPAHRLAEVLEREPALGEPQFEILFLGSCVAGMEEWAARLGASQVIYGFPGFSAALEGNRVSYVDRDERGEDTWGITVGGLRPGDVTGGIKPIQLPEDNILNIGQKKWVAGIGEAGRASEAGGIGGISGADGQGIDDTGFYDEDGLERETDAGFGRGETQGTEGLFFCQELFAAAGVPAVREPVMTPYYLGQAALRLPMLAALDIAGGSLEGLVNRNDLLKPMVKGIREGLAMIRAQGLPLVPSGLSLYRSVPIFVVVNSMRRGFKSVSSEIGIETFGRRSTKESAFLAGQLLELCRANGLAAPNLEFLFEAAFS